VPILYLLPSLGYAIYLSVSSGNPTLLFLVAASGLAMQLSRGLTSIRPDATLEFIGGRVRIGKKLLPRAPWLWPAAVRDRVYLQVCSVPESDRASLFESQRGSGGLYLGVTENGGPLTIELANHRCHALLIGPTGSGKTKLMRLIAAGWAGTCWVVDYKGGMGFEGSGVDRLITNLSADRPEFWAGLNELLDAREGGANGPPLLLLVDELGSVLQERDAALTLERVVSKGRSLGVHLVAANQTLSGVSRTLLANCQVRVGVGNLDPVDRAQLGQQRPCPANSRAVLIDQGREIGFWFSFDAEFEGPAALKTAPARWSGSESPNPLTKSSDFAGDFRQSAGNQRSLAGYSLNPIGQISRQHSASSADETQRLGFPIGRAMVDPGEPGEVSVSPEHQVGKGSSGKVRGANPVTDVTAAVTDAGAGV
jgi:hypothetical protein